MNGLDDLRDIRSPVPGWFRAAMSVPRDDGYVDVDGCAVHYLSWGDPANPGVVMTHGRMSHARCWAFVAPLLADHYHCVAFDLSGMGDSGTRETYTLAHRAAETVAVAEVTGMFEGGRKPYLVCHSYGGVIGLAAEERYPGKWSGFIACDMSLHHPGDTEGLKPRAGEKDEPRPHKIYPDLDTAVSRFRLAPEQPRGSAYLLEYIARHSVKRVSGGWTWKSDPKVYSIHEEGHNDWWIELTPKFVNLELPKAIVYGAHSVQVDGQVAEHVARASKDQVPVVRIADAHHHIMVDQPIALAAAVEALLQGFDAR